MQSVLPLPNELVLEILDNLPTVDVARCRQVSHKLQCLIDQTPRLRYKQELYLNGMRDVYPTSNINASILKLQRLRNTWGTFLSSHEFTVPCHRGGQHTDRCAYRVSAGILAQQKGPSGLVFHHIVPTGHDPIMREWSIEDVGFPILSFVMDASQDLLVVTELRKGISDIAIGMNIHILSLQTGHPHSSAQSPRLVVDYNGTEGRIAVQAETSGDFLGFMASTEFWDSISELWVWDWKCGKLVMNGYNNIFQAENDVYETITGAITFHFLDDRRILVPIIEESEENAPYAALYVYDCSRPMPGRTVLELIPRVATFHLPVLAETSEYAQLYCVANIPSAPPTLGTGHSFAPDPALDIVALQVGINPITSSVSAHPEYFYLFVHAGTLLAHCAPDGAGLAWADWAHAARLIRKPGDPEIWLLDEASGPRCLVMESITDEVDAPMAIMVYDFAPRAALRHDMLRAADGAGDGAEAGRWQYVLGETVLEDRQMWETRVVKSELPYRKLDTGFVAHPVEVDGDTKEHALSGNCYFVCDNQTWKIIYLG